MKERVWIKDEGIREGGREADPREDRKDDQSGAGQRGRVPPEGVRRDLRPLRPVFEACHFYLSRDRDPRFSPVGKVKQTIW